MNDLARQGITLFNERHEEQARDLFIQALRQDRQDAETWLWLAATIKPRVACWTCLGFAAQVDPTNETARKGVAHFAPDVQRRPEDDQGAVAAVEVYVAGTRYTARAARLHTLRLGDRLWLRREPHNRYDPNAVRVETEDDRVAGYLPRDMAASLARALDAEPQLVPARIIELTGYYPGYRMLTLKIAFSVPRPWLPEAQPEPLEYIYTDSEEHVYVLLDCSERLLERVASALQRCGLVVTYTGISTGAASDGRFYPWYLRLKTEDRPGAAALVEGCFESVFGVLPAAVRIRRAETQQRQLAANLIEIERDRDKLVEEGVGYLELSDGHVVTLREKDNEIATLSFQLTQNQVELDVLKRQTKTNASDSHPPELAGILQALLPDVELLRDSLQVLAGDTQGQDHALRLLQQIHYSPMAVRAETVESAQGFHERHFGKDGRLYFRRDPGGKIAILISDKASQPGDFRYLRKLA